MLCQLYVIPTQQKDNKMGFTLSFLLGMMLFQWILIIIVFAYIFYKFKKNCQEINIKNCNSLTIKYMTFASIILNLVLGGEFRSLIVVAIKFIVFIFTGWVTMIIGFKFLKIPFKKEELTNKKIWLYSIVLGLIANIIFSLSVMGIIYLLKI